MLWRDPLDSTVWAIYLSTVPVAFVFNTLIWTVCYVVIQDTHTHKLAHATPTVPKHSIFYSHRKERGDSTVVIVAAGFDCRRTTEEAQEATRWRKRGFSNQDYCCLSAS